MAGGVITIICGRCGYGRRCNNILCGRCGYHPLRWVL